jgi:hypothetical protein
MDEAFDAVCVKVQLSTGSEDRMTVGEKIIELARAGERNPDRLTVRLLAEFGIENDGSLWRHQRSRVPIRPGEFGPTSVPHYCRQDPLVPSSTLSPPRTQ